MTKKRKERNIRQRNAEYEHMEEMDLEYFNMRTLDRALKSLVTDGIKTILRENEEVMKRVLKIVKDVTKDMVIKDQWYLRGEEF